jgi:2-polyprenyl-6-methoxyphenol hydroxylase-like FAD-dependent oxidoreductase
VAGDWEAIVVGARCAGATLALELARRGARVLLVDQATFPSDTTSTHAIFPNTLARLESLGVMDRITGEHELAMVGNRLVIAGAELAGNFTPIGGYDRGTSITRPVLDHALVQEALAAGAHGRFGVKAVGLLGSGSEDDPVRGVALENGETATAPRTFGADGRASFVARALGLEKRNEMAGELGGFYAYWRGLPTTEYSHTVLEEGRQSLTWFPSEDGIHLVALNCEPHITKGDAATRERTYAEGIRRFPSLIDPTTFDRAERLGDLRTVPETMVRGFYRQAAGPGWALVGDAGHFKHPITAQGISDAIEQAIHLAAALDGADPELSSYESWRDDRSSGHYELSFSLATWPDDNAKKLFAGLADDEEAAQQFRDVLARTVLPSQIFTADRLARWFA